MPINDKDINVKGINVKGINDMPLNDKETTLPSTTGRIMNRLAIDHFIGLLAA